MTSSSSSPSSPEIPAYIESDDNRERADFDAAIWFRLATFEQIQELQNENWCRSQVADYVALDQSGIHPGIDRVLDYCNARSESRKEFLGYEVFVDGDAAREWLRQHRPDIAIALDLQDAVASED